MLMKWLWKMVLQQLYGIQFEQLGPRPSTSKTCRGGERCKHLVSSDSDRIEKELKYTQQPWKDVFSSKNTGKGCVGSQGLVWGLALNERHPGM